MAGGVIPKGDVDSRPIQEVQPSDVKGYTQCHFFAGLGGWAYALKLARWPMIESIWTGSAPCQPFSCAGKRKGEKDSRHLWPYLFRLIRACRPPLVMGEQVAKKAGYGWFDGVAANLEGEAYTCWPVDIPACAVNTPHRRNRLYWLAYRASKGLHASTYERVCSEEESARARNGQSKRCSGIGGMANSYEAGLEERQVKPTREECATIRGSSNVGRVAYTTLPSGSRLKKQPINLSRSTNYWKKWDTVYCGDGFNRRVEPGTFPLANGVPARIPQISAFGNAIVPQLAAEIIRSWMDVRGIQPGV